mmetsp:Transcript_11419/g.25895  ORF Transcript_11419/g.25895 Transcript_11419/m.25895 type:complete len:201 (-) Transcript_11419:246-848(-)
MALAIIPMPGMLKTCIEIIIFTFVALAKGVNTTVMMMSTNETWFGKITTGLPLDPHSLVNSSAPSQCNCTHLQTESVKRQPRLVSTITASLKDLLTSARFASGTTLTNAKPAAARPQAGSKDTMRTAFQATMYGRCLLDMSFLYSCFRSMGFGRTSANTAKICASTYKSKRWWTEDKTQNGRDSSQSIKTMYGKSSMTVA